MGSVRKALSAYLPRWIEGGSRRNASRALVDFGGGDFLTEAQCFEGIMIFGATGSGKTTGSAATLQRSFLSNDENYGFVVLCVKPGEADDWEAAAARAGRSGDVVRFGPGRPWRFNFLAYTAAIPGGYGRDPFNQVNLLEQVCEAAKLGEVQNSGGENAYFVGARKELITRIVVPMFYAWGELTIERFLDMVGSAPTSIEQVADAEWRARSGCYQTLIKAVDDPAIQGLEPQDVRIFATFWLKFWPTLDPKTRSNIVSTFTSALLPLTVGLIRDLFCTTTNVIPDVAREGAILIIDLPVKVYREAGILGNLIWKYLAQLMLERTSHPNARPVVLWTDESQCLTAKYDLEFQSTARSSKTITVNITQNLSGYYAMLPARDARAATDAILGNFQTKIFHQNTDPATNQYASDLIGKGIVRRNTVNWSSNHGHSDGQSWSYNSNTQIGESEGRSWGSQSSFGSSYGANGSSWSYSGGSNSGRNEGRTWSRSAGDGYSYTEGSNYGSSNGGGWTEVIDYIVEPRAFATQLRKGGPDNMGLVDAIIVQGGRKFNGTGAHWLPSTFQQ